MIQSKRGFPGDAKVVKNPLTNVGDLRDVGLTPGLGRSPGGGHGNPLHYSCLENPHGQRSLAGYNFRAEHFGGFLGGSDGKESTCNVGDVGTIPGLGRSPGGGHGNPLHYSCLENPHGQRSLEGYSPWGCKELDTTEQLSTAGL